MDGSFSPHETQIIPNSLSTSLSYHHHHPNFSIINADDDDDQNYNYYFDDLYYNPNYHSQCIDHRPSCQDSCYTNIPTNFTNDIILPTTTTAATFSESPSSAAIAANCLPETNYHHFHDQVFVGDKISDGNEEAKIVLRVKTKLEVLDDGYRWRKYGKKKVKSSPNLRNYYKCSKIGCKVKKRVERDIEDSSYVMATYIGIHNHEVPSHIPCNNCLTTMQFS